MTTPVPRDLEVDLSGVPRHWVNGSAVATAVSNGINMLFPQGERFFVRSVHRFIDRIDGELRARVKGFAGQEGRHARAHDDFNEVMRAQGYAIDPFLTRYQRISRWIEARMPATLNLAGTAAAEHFTAILAEGAFAKGILDAVDPRMQKLLAWHAAEEIEHKDVAFDVLAEVDPRYAVRVAGLVYATGMLAMFWMWGTAMLLRQENMTWRELLRDLRAQRRDPVIQRVFVRGIRQYLRRDFHPRDNDNAQLAAAWFAAHGMSLPDAA